MTRITDEEVIPSEGIKKPQTKDKPTPPGGAGSSWYQWTATSLIEQNRFLSKVTLTQLIINLSLVVIVVFLIYTRPTPQYFSVTPDLRVAQLAPLNQPYITSAGLSNWTANALTETLSFDFKHWRKTLSRAKPYFSDNGFKGLLAGMKKAGIIDRIESRRLFTSLTLDGSAQITASGVVKGVYRWRVEVPVILEYESSQGVTNKNKLLAVVMVERQDTRKKPKGIAIEQINLVPIRG